MRIVHKMANAVTFVWRIGNRESPKDFTKPQRTIQSPKKIIQSPEKTIQSPRKIIQRHKILDNETKPQNIRQCLKYLTRVATNINLT